ncbi:MAG TPA: ABC transporter permease [bacterium]|nr:ABC transporter permease [bacterium]HPN43951.1 ABC transporter permease [bacterium]
MVNKIQYSGKNKIAILYAIHIKKYITYAIPIIIFLLIWEIIADFKLINPLLFPPPTSVFNALKEWASTGELWRDVKASYWRMLFGFIIGGCFGIVFGMLTGRIKIFNQCLSPIIQLFRPLPPVAIIPLVIVWLGIGNIAKIFSISFAVFFPVWLNTHLGSSSVPSIYIWSAKLLRKSKIKNLFRVVLPAALPFIIAGLRTSIAIAFIMVYVSEIAGASQGIGYQISISHLAYRIDKMMAALFVLALAGVVADMVFTKTMKIIFPWIKTNHE